MRENEVRENFRDDVAFEQVVNYKREGDSRQSSAHQHEARQCKETVFGKPQVVRQSWNLLIQWKSKREGAEQVCMFTEKLGPRCKGCVKPGKGFRPRGR